MDGNDWFNIFECSNEFWQVRNRQIALSSLLLDSSMVNPHRGCRCPGTHMGARASATTMWTKNPHINKVVEMKTKSFP